MPTDTLITLGAAVAGFIAFAVVMGRWEKAAITAVGTPDHFQVKGFAAEIDRARNEMRIFVDGQRAFCTPLGHLLVEHKIETIAVAHEKKPKSFWDSMTLPLSQRRLLKSGRLVAQSSVWAETIWTAVETGKTWVKFRGVRLPAYYAQQWASCDEEHANVLTDRMDVPLPNSHARAFKLWLDHHKRELFPDHAAVRKAWDQTCAELLRACRQQRDHNANASDAFETWSFSAQPSIAYLVIATDGAASWASGDTPMLELVDKPSFKLAGNKLTVSSGDDSRSFLVPVDRMAPLQALQRRGIVQFECSPYGRASNTILNGVSAARRS